MQALEFSPYMENAISEVLEAMCFISSEGATPEDTKEVPTDWICGELDFLGDTSGRFGIAVPPGTAATIAANFLGEDESDLTEKATNEVICELTNMVCGTVLAQVDSKSIFTLSAPRPVSRGVSNAQYESIYRTYAIDEGFVHAWVGIKVVA